ncbi:MAG: AbrB family transcriptional regulator [Gammaproteobacteria bacterium]|nr:AbrB family transcriptional regulator [Gammaproteobacteria bacterium]
MELKIQSWGNSAAIRLNKGLLNQLDVEVGVSLDAEVSGGVLHLKPAEPVYTMDDLLVGCTRENMKLDDEDSQWLDTVPAGKEFK